MENLIAEIRIYRKEDGRFEAELWRGDTPTWDKLKTVNETDLFIAWLTMGLKLLNCGKEELGYDNKPLDKVEV